MKYRIEGKQLPTNIERNYNTTARLRVEINLTKPAQTGFVIKEDEHIDLIEQIMEHLRPRISEFVLKNNIEPFEIGAEQASVW